MCKDMSLPLVFKSLNFKVLKSSWQIRFPFFYCSWSACLAFAKMGIIAAKIWYQFWDRLSKSSHRILVAYEDSD